MAAFDIIAPTSEVDHYLEDNRRHGLVYSAEMDPEIIAEEEEEAGNLSRGSAQRTGVSPQEDDTDDSDLDSDGDEINGVFATNLNVAEKVCLRSQRQCGTESIFPPF